MPLSVNVVSEVRAFTTTSGRTVYVLDGQSGFDLDALIAACTSKACAPPPIGRGGSLRTGSLPNGADPEPYAQRLIKQTIANGNLEDRLFNLENDWEVVPKNPVVRMRIPLNSLDLVLHDDGTFRSQHDTGDSKGVLNPDTREKVETRMFSASGTKPKYGYLAEDGEKTDSAYALSGYGNISIEFKPSVNSRTTFTVGDSLTDEIAPMHVLDIASSSKERRMVTAPFGRQSYVEAQIHGDLTLKDVMRIYVERKDYYGYNYQTGTLTDEPNFVFKKLMNEYPDIEIYVSPTHDRLTFSVCKFHGEFACNSKSCAPPPVGTGGSISTAVQHVTSREAGALIKSGGFLVGRGEMNGSIFGDGIYLSMAGDKRASEMYRSGVRTEGYEPALVRATVKLKRPLKVSGDTKDEVFDDLVEQLGGSKGVIEAATKSYGRLRDSTREALKKVLGSTAADRVDWNGEFESDPVFNDMSSEQYADFVSAVDKSLPHGIVSFGDYSGISSLRKMMSGKATSSSWSRAVSNLVADLGYDGIEIVNERFAPHVGGSQIVVFDPKTITVDSVEDFSALDRIGVSVVFAYETEVFACTEHGEFACTSRACAPPPVGTGGSSPSSTATAERWTGGEATVAVAPRSAQYLTLSDIHSTWPRDRSEVMKLLGNAEPYPEGFKVSESQGAAISAVSAKWIKTGGSIVPVIRRLAVEAIEDGVDRVAGGEQTRGDNDQGLLVRTYVARVLTAVRSAPKSTVWRGLRVSQEVLDQLKVGGVYSEALATATGRRTLAMNFARGKFGSVGQKRSGTVQVLLKMHARNLPIGGEENGDLVALADERFISGKFRVVSVSKERSTHIIEVEQIDE